MEEYFPPTLNLPWATPAEMAYLRQARLTAVQRVRVLAEAVARDEAWLAQDDQAPGYLPAWQRKSIETKLAGQKQLLASSRTLVDELTRRPTDLDPLASALLAATSDLVTAARLQNTRLRVFTVTVSPVAWRTLAPEFTWHRGMRVLETDDVTLRLDLLDTAEPDKLLLDCKAGQWQTFVPPPSVPAGQDSRRCYDQLRRQGYSREEAAFATCDLALAASTPDPSPTRDLEEGPQRPRTIPSGRPRSARSKSPAPQL